MSYTNTSDNKEMYTKNYSVCFKNGKYFSGRIYLLEQAQVYRNCTLFDVTFLQITTINKQYISC